MSLMSLMSLMSQLDQSTEDSPQCHFAKGTESKIQFKGEATYVDPRTLDRF